MKKLLFIFTIVISFIVYNANIHADGVIKIYKNGSYTTFHANEVDSIVFASSPNPNDSVVDEDIYDPSNVGQIMQEKYNQAFIATFGMPAANQDWGFNETTRGIDTYYSAANNHTSEESEFTFLCRIFAEDLSVMTSSDFDFNDVVFDVYTNSQNQAKVVINAVGSTLPLTIAGYEVHDLYRVPISTMVNTYAYQGGVSKDAVELPILIDDISTAADVNTKIVVKVTIKDTECELKAQRGMPAAKLAVSEKVGWCNERENISYRYPNFSEWVRGYIDCWWK